MIMVRPQPNFFHNQGTRRGSHSTTTTRRFTQTTLDRFLGLNDLSASLSVVSSIGDYIDDGDLRLLIFDDENSFLSLPNTLSDSMASSIGDYIDEGDEAFLLFDNEDYFWRLPNIPQQ